MISFSFTCTASDVEIGRLDKAVLARAPRSGRALVAECFAGGGVLARGRAAAKSLRPEPGMEVRVLNLAERDDPAISPEPDAPLSIVWRDDSAGLVAFDKPAGQPCQPLRRGERGTLAGAVVAQFPETVGVGDDPRMPGLLHRIDAGTSGLVLAALSQKSWLFARDQFSARSVRKTYLARVIGRVDAPGGASGFLAHTSSFRGKMRPVSSSALPGGERAMFAETFWKPISSDGSSTLLEVEIRTGVTHQIRCQLAAAGHPIEGDTLYGAPTALAGPHGPWHRLHSLAATLSLPSGATKTIRTKPPCWA